MRVPAHGARMSLTAPRAEPRRLACARCGAAFECGSAQGSCWCFEENVRLPMPAADSTEDCLCPACLRATASSSPGRREAP